MKKSCKLLLLLLATSTILCSCNSDAPSQQTSVAITDPSADSQTLPAVITPSAIPALIWDSENIKLVMETYRNNGNTKTETTIKKSKNSIEAYVYESTKTVTSKYAQWYTIYIDLEKNEIYYPAKRSNSSEPKYNHTKLKEIIDWRSFLHTYNILIERDLFAFQDENYVALDDKNYVGPQDLFETYKALSLTSLQTVCKDDRITISAGTSKAAGKLTVTFLNPTVRYPEAKQVDEPFSLAELKQLPSV